MTEQIIQVPIAPIASRSGMSGGTQDIYRFENGYGASVVRNDYSYGGPDLFELAVVRFKGPGDYDWKLTYKTPITEDVIGYLTPEAVKDLLVQVQALKPRV